MSNNNIIDGSGITVEALSGSHVSDISAPSGALSLTEIGSLGCYGDIVAYGTSNYSDPSQDANINHTPGSWKSTYNGVNVIPAGNVGAAWMYNKTSGITTELVEPLATKSRQGRFGNFIHVTSSYIYVNSHEYGWWGLEGKVHIFDHSGTHVNTIIGPTPTQGQEHEFASGDGFLPMNGNIVANDNFLFVTAVRYPNNQYHGAIFVYSADGSTLIHTITGGSNYAFRYRSLGIRGDKLVSTDGSYIQVIDISDTGGSPSMNIISTGSGNNDLIGRSVTFINDDYFVVGYRYSSINPSSGQQGALRVYRVSDCAQVFAYDNPTGYDSTSDDFGKFIASDSVNNTIAVGTSTYDTRSGVHIFSANSDGSLTHETSIFPSDVSTIAPSNYFGMALSFNDGTLLIGDSKSDSNAGSVSIFDVGTVAQPREITVTGNVQQGSFSPYAAGGYSTQFSSGYSDIAASSDFAIGTDDFTFETWVKVDTDLTGPIRIFALDGGSGEASSSVYCKINASSVTTALGEVATSVSFNDKDFHHVAVSRSSGTTKMFVDGVQVSSVTDATSYTPVASPSPRIMNSAGNITLSNMRLVKGSAIYTSAFTPPTESLTLTNETVLLTCNKPYMSAVANEYTPASVSTTEAFTDAESATMVSGYDSSYPGLGSERNLKISPNGEHTVVGASNYRYSGSSNRGIGYLLSTDNLGSITYQSLAPTGYTAQAFQNIFRNVEITDTHVAFNTGHVGEGGNLTSLSTKISTAVLNSNYPAGVMTGSSDWEFKPNYAFYSLNDLSTITYLATPGVVTSTNCMSMHGNYIVLVDVTTTVGGDHTAGMWVYDITDTSLVASLGGSFAPTGSQTYIDVNQGNHLFPKYYIPNQTGNLADYATGTGVSVSISGDYIVRGASSASSNTGRVEVFKISELKTIASGLTQASPHAVITGGSATQAARLGYHVKTDGTNILVAGFDTSKAYINVHDMDGTSVADINVKDFNSNSGFVIDDIALSSDYIMVGSRNFHGTSGISGAGGYALLDRSDPSVVLKEGHGESTNQKMGHSVAIAGDQTFFAHCSQLSSENGELNLESITATPAGYSSVLRSPTLSGDVGTERSAPYDYLDYAAASHGGSAYFDGNGDRINTAATEDFHFGTGDFTIEFWMKPIPNGYASSSHTVMSHSITSNTANGWRINYQESTKAIKWVSGNGVYINAAGFLEANIWNHVAITRASGFMTIYVNGVVGPQSAYPDALDYTPSDDKGLYIGGYDTSVEASGASTSRDAFSGFLSDVRVVKGSGVYTDAFTPPTAPLTAVTGTTLLLPFDDATIIDKSGSSIISVQGDVAVSDVAPPYAGGKAFTFDGSGDYVEAQDAGISLSGDFTIEAWVKASSTSGNQQIVAFPGTTYDAGISTSGASFLFADGTADLITAGTVVANQWHHVAVSRSSGTVTLFVDGASVGTSSGHTVTVGTSGDVNVGSNTSNGNLLTGELADIRIVESAVYTDAFTPPTGSYWG